MPPRRPLLLALSLLLLPGCPSPPAPSAAPRYTVRLVSSGPDPAAVSAAVGSVSGHSPRIAEELVRRAPVPVLVAVPRDEAERARAALAAAGAEAVLLEVPPPP